MTEKTLNDLRAPFPANVVGKLPKPTTKDGRKGTCPECGTYHAMPAVHLDFVGHAAVTDRLLSVDPGWSWEPLALDEHGLPKYDGGGGLWIKLTVLGTTRLGYGDGPDPKQRIGDAIRNAAMRFGVALDLWTKGELESTDPNGGGGDTIRPLASSHAGDAYSHPRKAQREHVTAPQQSEWDNVANPPVVTDAVWLKTWESIVGRAETKEDWQGAWTELVAAVKAGQISEPDAAAAKQLWQDALKDQTETNARREKATA